MLVLAALSGAALLASALPATAAADGEEPVGAAELLAKVKNCTPVSKGKYRTDRRAAATIPVCGTDEVVFWEADMDIDCDGQVSTVCNTGTDLVPAADGLPGIGRQVPGLRRGALRRRPRSRPALELLRVWDQGGGVAAVIHDGKVRYAVVGDTGPAAIIGEGSYALARSLGIDPDPRTGGTASGVTYILFRNSQASPIESPAAAVAAGEALARKFADGA